MPLLFDFLCRSRAGIIYHAAITGKGVISKACPVGDSIIIAHNFYIVWST